MKTLTQQLLALADALAAYQGITHWAISSRLLGKGDFFEGLQEGGDCKTRTYEKVMSIFAREWPEDLEWPADVPRPKVIAKGKAA